MVQLEEAHHAWFEVDTPTSKVRIDCSGPYPNGDCPSIMAFRGTYFEQIDILSYVEQKYDVTYAGRWYPVLYLFIFCIGVQMLHILAGRFVVTVNR